MSIRSVRRSVRAWGRRQMYSFFSSIGALLSHRVGTLMTVLVLGVAMALPLGLHLTLANLEGVDLREEEWGAVTVFLVPDASAETARQLAAALDNAGEATATLISPEEGLETFSQQSGFGQAAELFEDNPLPWVMLANPVSESETDLVEAVPRLVEWLEQQPAVDSVQVDYKWLQRLSGLMELGRAFVVVLISMFSMAVVVVVANTIRLDVANRSEEIQVLSLVGAGDSFIRQPFLYGGFWYGMLGALVALILLSLSLFYLHQPLEHMMHSFGQSFELEGLSVRSTLLVLLAGGLLGLAGAAISVQRYLHQLKVSGSLGRR